MLNNQIHRFFFLLGIALMIIALPFSPFLLSLGQFILAFNWLFELRFKEKLTTLYKRPSILLLLSVFMFHIIWLLNTSNFEYALHDIKIKLPLLSLPVILGTSQVLNKKELQYILHLFLGAILVSTLISGAIYIGVGKADIIDNRNISIFISHIRFALMVDLACFILLGIMLDSKNYMLLPTYNYIVILIWLLLYVLFMGAFSGIVISLLTSPFLLYYWLKKQNNIKIKRTVITSFISLSILLFVYLGCCVIRFTSKSDINLAKLPSYTVNGNPYSHHIKNTDYENGYRVWLYVSNIELKEQWNTKSKIKLGKKDLKGQWIESTLVRYLTSLNYTKDSVGISQLSLRDIEMIEKGYTNYIFKYKWSVYPRIYEIFWEIDNYIRAGNPSGHSISQRLEFIKNGVNVTKRFFWLGTGTGDINDEVLLQYKLDNSVLDSDSQYRPHNQYISFFIAFGCIGFCLMIIFVYKGVLLEKQNVDFIFIAFLLIALFSMINEDTLETQAGASFVAFFLSILIFGRKPYE